MSKDLSAEWLEDEEVIEEEEVVFTGSSESPYIQGYGAYATKITMAKRLVFDKSKVEFIEIDFVNQDNKTHTEKFMVRGKDGKPFFMDKKTKKKKAHFGVSKIKSLLKVVGLYTDVDNVMKELYSNTEEADVTYNEYGKEKTEEFTIFTDLIGKKVQLCITSKRVNATTASDQDDDAEQKYVDQCIKDTKKYCLANPKKKSIQKHLNDTDYVNVYKNHVESSVAHFCTLDGLFGGEIESGEGIQYDKFIGANEEGFVYDARTLICDDMDEKQLAKLGINKWGKRVEVEEDDGYEEPTESEEEEDDDDW